MTGKQMRPSGIKEFAYAALLTGAAILAGIVAALWLITIWGWLS